MTTRSRLIALVGRRRLPRRTIRLRLTMLFGALFLVSGAGLLAVTYALVSHATGGVLVANGADGSVAVFSRAAHPVAAKGAPNEVVGTQILKGEGTPARLLPPAQGRLQAEQLRAQALRQHANEMHQLLLQSAIALGVMALISIVLGWLVAGRVLRPLRTITPAARNRSPANLHERLALEGPDDELKELGDTFDALFERLDASFQSQRQFVANASHELRTPLARQRTLSQGALGDPDATIASLRTAHEH